MTSLWRHRAFGKYAPGVFRKKSTNFIQKFISLAVVGIFSNGWHRWKAENKGFERGTNHFCDIGSESIKKSFQRYRLFRLTRKSFPSSVDMIDVWNLVCRSLIVSSMCMSSFRVVSSLVRLQSAVAYRYYVFPHLNFSIKHKLLSQFKSHTFETLHDYH